MLARPAFSMPALLFLVVLPHAFTLLYFVQPDLDDSWYASRGWAVLHTGWAYGPLDQGILNNYDGYWTYFGLVGNYFVAASEFLFGPTLLAVRLVSLLFGITLLALVYFIARKLFSHNAGMLAMLIGGFSFPFTISAHLGRQDIFVTTFAFGALALYLYQSDEKFSLASFFSGLLLGLTLDIHLPGIIFPPMIAALAIYDYKWKIFKSGRIWGIVAGFCSAAAYFLLAHVVPYSQTYSAIAKVQQGSTITTLPITKFDLSLWWRSIAGLDFLVGTSTLAVSALALAILLYRARRDDIRFTVLFLALLTACAAILLRKVTFYAILLAPVFWVLLGVGAAKVLDALRESKQRQSLRTLAAALIAATFCMVSIPALPLLLHNSYPDYEAAMQFIREAAPTGKTILGNGNYWFARPDQPYYSWQQLVYYERERPGSTLEEAFRTLKPDYIVLDDLTESFLLEDNYVEEVNTYTNLAVSKREMLAFLSKYTTLTSEAQNSIYGDIRVYRINW